ncbi:OmpA family protein [Chitinibacteraceae bacterium HSL-7]
MDLDSKIALAAAGVITATTLVGTLFLVSEHRLPAGASAHSATSARPFVVTPLELIARDGVLRLRGEVADLDSKLRLLRPAQLLWGKAHVIDELRISPAQPAFWWHDRPINVLARLKALDTFDVQLDRNGIRLAGVASNAAQLSRIAGQAGDWFAPGLSVDNQIILDVRNDVLPLADNVFLNETIEFDTGSANVQARWHERLQEIAIFLVEDGRPVTVLGHTDRTGDAAANLTLSQARADTVRMLLIAYGVPAGQLKSIGMGDQQPIADNASETGRQHNRRIEFAS